LGKAAVSPEQFSSFGDLLKYLRRREGLTQRELAIQVGYSDTQISRLEQNRRVPDEASLKAHFVPALHLEHEADWVERLLQLARQARLRDLAEPETETVEPSETVNNLPALLTTFIGREKEQAEIEQLLTTHRLVTLTGSGGVGKTRLSLQVGGHILDRFANGVWFVELAPLGDPDLLAQTVASVFGLITQSSSISFTQLLINHLRSRTALLILDNCEHLLDACAQLTDTILKNCPQLKVLATSRQPLGILGEIQYRLPSLELPAGQQTLEEIGKFEAVRLFEERAQLAQPDFQLTLENAVSVAQICSRLDGIPLAIELAAVRVNIFSTEQLAARLMDCFDLLTGGSRTALPHQQTIRTSIDWSWNLISDAERTLLQRLTVFAGGWTVEAAEAVCSSAGSESEQVLELMTQLVAKSLVNVNRQRGGERRFDMHATIHQYAHEKLVEAGEHSKTHDRHLSYYLDLSTLAETEMNGPQQMIWFDRINDERDNIRAALGHALETDLEAGLYLSGRLHYYWRYYDQREALRWTTAFVQIPESKPYTEARARALLAQGSILWNMQQFKAARSVVEECLTVFRACHDRQGEFEALSLMAGVIQFVAGMEERIGYLQQALDLARSMGDPWREGLALSNLGWDQRDPQLGRRHWEEAIVLLRQVGDWRNLAQTLGILGFTVLSNGDLEAAQKYLDEASSVNQQINNNEMEFVLTGKGILALLRGEYGQARAYLEKNAGHLEEVGNRMGLLWARARIAFVTLCEGNVEEARPQLADAVQNFYADQNKSGLAFTLDKMANLYVVTDQPAAAARLIGWSDAAREELGDPRPRIEQVDLDRDIAAIKAKIGSFAFEAAYQSGGKMTMDEIVASAIGKE
jgi:predicted ATPase